MTTLNLDQPGETRVDDSQESKANRAIELARTAEEQVHASDQAWIAELAQEWRDHHGRGLRLRFETGVRLNSRFGPPTERQKRGENVMQLVAKETGVDQSDLNRMRWFAFRFQDYTAFQSACPEATTWNQVRLLLVEMAQKENAAQGSPDAESSAEDKAKVEFRKVKQSLVSLVERLDKPLRLDVDAEDELYMRLRQLSRALKTAFGVQLTISDTSELAST
jgi:hypothetical protein